MIDNWRTLRGATRRVMLVVGCVILAVIGAVLSDDDGEGLP